jgi:hypothetical protein
MKTKRLNCFKLSSYHLICSLLCAALSASAAAATDPLPRECLQAKHWTQHPQQVDTAWIDNPPLWGTYRPGIYFGKAALVL